MDPLGLLRASMRKMKIMPEICPCDQEQRVRGPLGRGERHLRPVLEAQWDPR